MKTEQRDKLLDKYYRGETSLDEEILLKKEIAGENSEMTEKDIFDFFQIEGAIPENLEEKIFENIEKSSNKKKVIKMRWVRITSVAATIAILLTAFLGYQNAKKEKIENEFMLMEQAFYQVSQSIKPQEQEEMLVLWIDDDVEIIIN